MQSPANDLPCKDLINFAHFLISMSTFDIDINNKIPQRLTPLPARSLNVNLNDRLMHTAMLITQGLLGVIFLFTGGSKLAGTEPMRKDFNRFGYPSGFRLFTGLMEGTAAALLLAGFWWPALAAWGAALVLTVMIGAVWTHLVRVGDRSSEAAPAIVLGALACWVVVAQWPF
jgi:uncharacterized membrane protein YphA (DoxX/SURF4 family)